MLRGLLVASYSPFFFEIFARFNKSSSGDGLPFLHVSSFSRRAGQAVAGFEKARAQIAEGAALILAARDGAADGKSKIEAKARDLPIYSVLDAAEIGAAFGREKAVHVAVAPGGLAKRLGRSLKRLQGFRAV